MRHNEFELFAACRCDVAEGPRWNEREKMLYWVDIPQGTVYRKKLNTAPEEFESFDTGLGKVGAYAFYDGRLLIFAASCKVWLCDFGGKPELFAGLPNHENTRFNDIFVDRYGHIFCGAAWNQQLGIPGELWKFSPENKKFEQLEQNLSGMPNGMGVSPDRKTLYFAVSEELKVYAYDLDESAGTVSNRRVFAEFQPEGGNPDGLAVDPETGDIAIAFWNGKRMLVLSPSGEIVREHKFPIAKITSAEYAPCGLFATSGNYPWKEEDFIENKAGSVWLKRK